MSATGHWSNSRREHCGGRLGKPLPQDLQVSAVDQQDQAQDLQDQDQNLQVSAVDAQDQDLDLQVSAVDQQVSAVDQQDQDLDLQVSAVETAQVDHHHCIKFHKYLIRWSSTLAIPPIH